MGIQALIINVDGTLAQTADLHRKAFNQTFTDLGLDWHWDREIFSKLALLENDPKRLSAFSKAIAALDKVSPLTASAQTQLLQLKTKTYTRMIRHSDLHLRPGVSRLLSEARHEGIILAAVSNGPLVEYEALILHLLGFDALGWFETCQTAPHSGNPYTNVVNRIGLNPDRCVAIDDSATGIAAAKTAGLTTIATPSLYTASQQFRAADLVISDLGEPAAPFNLIQGQHGISDYISPQFLQNLGRPAIYAA